MIKNKRAVIIAGVTTLVLAAGGGAAYGESASIPDSSGVIHGCYKPTTHGSRSFGSHRHRASRRDMPKGPDGTELESDRTTRTSGRYRAGRTNGCCRTSGRYRADGTSRTVNGRSWRSGNYGCPGANDLRVRTNNRNLPQCRTVRNQRWYPNR